MKRSNKLGSERDAALAQHRNGALNEAEAAYYVILEQFPDDAEAHHLLGILKGQKGDPEAAVRLIKQAIELDDTVGRYFGNLAVTLQDLGRDEEALEQFQQAVERDESPDTLYDLALALRNVGFARMERREFAAAAESYQKAADLLPEDPEVFNDLGCALRNIGKHDQALDAFQQAIDLRPQYTQALTNLGNALQEMGRFSAAVDTYRRALAARPEEATVYAALAEAKTFARGDSDFEHMLDLAQFDDLPQTSRSQLGFALAKACEDMGDYEAAYTHLASANDAMRRSFDYDISSDERRIARIIDIFDDRLVDRLDGFGATTERPIFIVGMPRSGTSLAEQILASHRQVFGAGELTDFQRGALDLVNGEYPDGLLDVTPSEIGELAARYLGVLSIRNDSASRVTDKLPVNFLYVGLIYAAFPNARIIHCVRDPLDTCLSCYRKSFAEAYRFTYDLQELGRYYRAYARLMTHWQQLFPDRLFELQYETVIDDPEATIRRLVSYCGLDWDEACMRFYETERSVQTASAAQVRRPLYSDSIAAWRRYADHLKPLRAALGL